MRLYNLFYKLSRGFSKITRMETKPELDCYVWIDLELTGLDFDKDTILEAACIITTPDLNPVDKGINLVINHPEEVLKSMNQWSRTHHAKTGLTFECRKSKISLEEADKVLSDYVQQHANFGGQRYIAGNTVYMDKVFIEKRMPKTANLFHYRIIDVSSLKTLCSHWYTEEYNKLPRKKNTHRALDDITESINELKALQKLIFK